MQQKVHFFFNQLFIQLPQSFLHDAFEFYGIVFFKIWKGSCDHPPYLSSLSSLGLLRSTPELFPPPPSLPIDKKILEIDLGRTKPFLKLK